MTLARDYILQHRLLKILLDKSLESVNNPVSINERSVTVKSIFKKLGINRNRLSYLSLEIENDGFIKKEKINGDFVFYSVDGISDAYWSKKYLIQGRKKLHDSIYDLTKWLLPIIVIMVSLYTIVASALFHLESDNLKQDILHLQQQADSMKQKVQTLGEEQKVLKKNDSIVINKSLLIKGTGK